MRPGAWLLCRFLLRFKRLRVLNPSSGTSPQGVIDMKVEEELGHVSRITL
jgi:hypothetical protein